MPKATGGSLRGAGGPGALLLGSWKGSAELKLFRMTGSARDVTWAGLRQGQGVRVALGGRLGRGPHPVGRARGGSTCVVGHGGLVRVPIRFENHVAELEHGGHRAQHSWGRQSQMSPATRHRTTAARISPLKIKLDDPRAKHATTPRLKTCLDLDRPLKMRPDQRRPLT